MKPNKAQTKHMRALYAILGDPLCRRYYDCSAEYLYARMRAAGWKWDRRALVWVKPVAAEAVA